MLDIACICATILIAGMVVDQRQNGVIIVGYSRPYHVHMTLASNIDIDNNQ